MTVLLLLLLAVVGSALFAGLETGLVSQDRVRLRVRAQRGDGRAQALLTLLERPERILSTFLVGNTLCNIGGGALATAWAAERLGETAGGLLATFVMTSVFLVFSEVVPKTYFRRRAEEAVPRFLWFMKLAAWAFTPVVWLVSSLFRLISGESGKSPFVTREELRQLVREAGGRLGIGQRRMLESVFDFGHTVVREVMIPLPGVISLPETADVETLKGVVRTRGYTRIPLYRERVDQITGLVNVYDVLYEEAEARSLVGYARPLLVVPETQRIHRLMIELQRRREAMALVVNEFGAVLGIVTLEDIVEEIMGELADEHEELTRPLQRVGEGWILDATLDIDDLNEELGLSLVKDQYETVAGLLMKRLGRIPRVGEKILVDHLQFEVLAVHRYGIRRLRLVLPEASKEDADDDG